MVRDGQDPGGLTRINASSSPRRIVWPFIMLAVRLPGHRSARRRSLAGALAWVAVALVVLGGCASRRAAREVAGAEARLRHIEIEGNERLSDEHIEEHLNLKETTWFPLPQRRYLSEGLVPVDAERIEELYSAHGHYDAKVTESSIHRHPKRDVADVRFTVDEGPPTMVRRIRFEWPEGPPSGPPDRRARTEAIETHCGLTVGAPFDAEELNNSEATMIEALQSRGYAQAEVDARAEVDRVQRYANVVFTLRPGPFLRIGAIRIEGLQSVPERLVMAEVDEYEAKPFSPRRVRRMEEAIYALGVFSSVTAVPDAEPHDGRLDFTITVREGKPQRLELGVGLGLEPNRWEQYGQLRYTHENLLRNLTHFDVRLRAGYAELVAIGNDDDPFELRAHGPLVELEPTLRKKGWLEPELVWTLRPSFELGLQEGYQFYAPSNRVGVARFFTRFVEAGISHNVRFVDFFALSPTLDGNRSLLGLDFRDPYLLSFVQLELKLYLTDALLTPTNGVILGATYDIAGGIFGGQFDYHKVIPELRAYWTPLRRRLQLAARGRLGFIVPFGDEPGAPFDLKLYLGGANTMRGWGLRRLSPTVERCDDGGRCSRIPVGGNTSWLGNVEARVRMWKELWGVAFFDVGDVHPEVATFVPRRWNYAVGPGLRYDSPIGTIRLDVGIRVNDPAEFRDQPRWAVHFGLGETF